MRGPTKRSSRVRRPDAGDARRCRRRAAGASAAAGGAAGRSAGGRLAGLAPRLLPRLSRGPDHRRHADLAEQAAYLEVLELPDPSAELPPEAWVLDPSDPIATWGADAANDLDSVPPPPAAPSAAPVAPGLAAAGWALLPAVPQAARGSWRSCSVPGVRRPSDAPPPGRRGSSCRGGRPQAGFPCRRQPVRRES
jgi:hypothetical protein